MKRRRRIYWPHVISLVVVYLLMGAFGLAVLFLEPCNPVDFLP